MIITAENMESQKKNLKLKLLFTIYQNFSFGFISREGKKFKKTIKFDSLYKWIKTLDKLKKKKNVTLINELGYDSFKSLIIF